MSQTIFVDPSVVSNVPGAGNSGNGVVTLTLLSHFTVSQTYTITCIQTTPTAIFSVVGSLDGSVGLATQGLEFIDQDKKIGLIVTAGGVPFSIGDTFTVEVEQGTDVTQANLDLYDELPQKNFSAGNDDSLRYSDADKKFTFNSDENSDPGNFFEGNALVESRDFLTHGATTYPYVTQTSQKETGDETLFRKVFKLTPAAIADSTVNVSGSSIIRADGTTFQAADVDGKLINFSATSIDFSTGTGTNVRSFTPVTLGPGEFVYYGLVLSVGATTEIQVVPGQTAASSVAAITPELPQATTRIGFILVEDSGSGGSGNLNPISQTAITQLFSFGVSSAQGDGTVQEILTLKYAAGFLEDLEDEDALDQTNTTGTFIDRSVELQYDNKTISVVGNNITLGSAPAFTVQVGDVVVQGSAVQLITIVNSQTDFDVADGSVLTTGNNATISQKFQSIDLTQFGDAETRSSDFYQSDIEQALIWYEDATFQDTLNSPSLAFSLSSDGTFYTDVSSRPNDFTEDHSATTISTFSNSLTIRFFSNISIGSGTATLQSYRAYYHLRNQIGQLVGNTSVVREEIRVVGFTTTNNSGLDIDPLRVVRADGSGGIIVADKASLATGVGIGITVDPVVNSDSGTIATSGIIQNANGSLGFLEGTELFLGTNGEITDIPPVSGEYALKVGEILGNDLVVQLERRGIV